jgi:hypothetical protein
MLEVEDVACPVDDMKKQIVHVLREGSRRVQRGELTGHDARRP